MKFGKNQIQHHPSNFPTIFRICFGGHGGAGPNLATAGRRRGTTGTDCQSTPRGILEIPCMFFLTVGGKHSARRKRMHAQGKHANPAGIPTRALML